MISNKYRHRLWFKTIAIGVVCLFTFNSIAWSMPEHTLAAQSRFNLFSTNNELGLQNTATILYAVNGLKGLISSDTLSRGSIVRLNKGLDEDFSDNNIAIGTDFEEGMLKKGREYKIFVFRFKKENIKIETLFFHDHTNLTSEEKDELRKRFKLKNDRDRAYLDCPGLEGVWFVNPKVKIALVNLISLSHLGKKQSTRAVRTLAAYLHMKNAPVEIEIIDMQQFYEEALKTMKTEEINFERIFDYMISSTMSKLAEVNADIVGLSMKWGTLRAADEITRRAKRELKNQPLIVLGNLLPTFVSAELLKRPNYEDTLCILGEGEEALFDIVTTVKANRGKLFSNRKSFRRLYGETPNVRFNAKDGTLSVPSLKRLELEEIPDTNTPDWISARHSAGLEGSRGCPWGKCTYCSVRSLFGSEGVHKRNVKVARTSEWKAVTAKEILRAMRRLAERGVRRIHFLDSEFFGPTKTDAEFEETMNRVEQIADGIIEINEALRSAEDTEMVITNFSARVDTIYKSGDKEKARNIRRRKVYEKLKQAGLLKVYLGIESGSPEQLRRYGKGITVEESEKAIAILQNMGINIEAGFIFLDPLATIEDLRKNIEFVERTKLYETQGDLFNSLRLHTGCPYLQIAMKNGLVTGEIDLNTLSYPYKYSDPKIGRIEQIFREWDNMIKIAANRFLDFRGIEYLADNQKNKLKYFVARIRKMEYEVIKALANRYEEVEKIEISDILSENKGYLSLINEILDWLTLQPNHCQKENKDLEALLKKLKDMVNDEKERIFRDGGDGSEKDTGVSIKSVNEMLWSWNFRIYKLFHKRMALKRSGKGTGHAIRSLDAVIKEMVENLPRLKKVLTQESIAKIEKAIFNLGNAKIERSGKRVTIRRVPYELRANMSLVSIMIGEVRQKKTGVSHKRFMQERDEPRVFYDGKAGEWYVRERRYKYSKGWQTWTLRYGYHKYKTLWEAFRAVDHQIDAELTEKAYLAKCRKMLRDIAEGTITDKAEMIEEIASMLERLKRIRIEEKVLARAVLNTAKFLLEIDKEKQAKGLFNIASDLFANRINEISHIVDTLSTKRVDYLREQIKGKNSFLMEKAAKILHTLTSGRHRLAAIIINDDLLAYRGIRWINEPDFAPLKPSLELIREHLARGPPGKADMEALTRFFELFKRRVIDSIVVSNFMTEYRNRFVELCGEGGLDVEATRKAAFDEVSAKYINEDKNVKKDPVLYAKMFHQAAFVPVRVTVKNGTRVPNPEFTAISDEILRAEAEQVGMKPEGIALLMSSKPETATDLSAPEPSRGIQSKDQPGRVTDKGPFKPHSAFSEWDLREAPIVKIIRHIVRLPNFVRLALAYTSAFVNYFLHKPGMITAPIEESQKLSGFRYAMRLDWGKVPTKEQWDAFCNLYTELKPYEWGLLRVNSQWYFIRGKEHKRGKRCYVNYSSVVLNRKLIEIDIHSHPKGTDDRLGRSDFRHGNPNSFRFLYYHNYFLPYNMADKLHEPKTGDTVHIHIKDFGKAIAIIDGKLDQDVRIDGRLLARIAKQAKDSSRERVEFELLQELTNDPAVNLNDIRHIDEYGYVDYEISRRALRLAITESHPQEEIQALWLEVKDRLEEVIAHKDELAPLLSKKPEQRWDTDGFGRREATFLDSSEYPSRIISLSLALSAMEKAPIADTSEDEHATHYVAGMFADMPWLSDFFSLIEVDIYEVQKEINSHDFSGSMRMRFDMPKDKKKIFETIFNAEIPDDKMSYELLINNGKPFCLVWDEGTTKGACVKVSMLALTSSLKNYKDTVTGICPDLSGKEFKIGQIFTAGFYNGTILMLSWPGVWNSGGATKGNIAHIVDKHAKDDALCLDMGCGGGSMSLSWAAKGGRVVATDINPLAVAATRYNSIASGLSDRIEVVGPGDLFEKVKGRKFPYIMFVPPVNPSDIGVTMMWVSGYGYNETNKSDYSRILRGFAYRMADYLEEDGTCFVVHLKALTIAHYFQQPGMVVESLGNLVVKHEPKDKQDQVPYLDRYVNSTSVGYSMGVQEGIVRPWLQQFRDDLAKNGIGNRIYNVSLEDEIDLTAAPELSSGRLKISLFEIKPKHEARLPRSSYVFGIYDADETLAGYGFISQDHSGSESAHFSMRIFPEYKDNWRAKEAVLVLAAGCASRNLFRNRVPALSYMQSPPEGTNPADGAIIPLLREIGFNEGLTYNVDEARKKLPDYHGAPNTSIHVALDEARRMHREESFDGARKLLQELLTDLRAAQEAHGIETLMEKWDTRYPPTPGTDLLIDHIPKAISDAEVLLAELAKEVYPGQGTGMGEVARLPVDLANYFDIRLQEMGYSEEEIKPLTVELCAMVERFELAGPINKLWELSDISEMVSAQREIVRKLTDNLLKEIPNGKNRIFDLATVFAEAPGKRKANCMQYIALLTLLGPLAGLDVSAAKPFVFRFSSHGLSMHIYAIITLIDGRTHIAVDLTDILEKLKVIEFTDDDIELQDTSTGGTIKQDSRTYRFTDPTKISWTPDFSWWSKKAFVDRYKYLLLKYGRSFRQKAERIHTENLKLAYMPNILPKTMLCHIITDSILPSTKQKKMLKKLGQDMRKDKTIEKVVCLEMGDKTDSKTFMRELEKVKAQEQARYQAKGYTVQFDIACPNQDLVAMVQDQMPALAFENTGNDEHAIIQLEGIMLALRVLRTGTMEDLRNVYKLLTDQEPETAKTMKELAKKLLFTLPITKLDVDEIDRINTLIEENIRNAA